MQLFGSSATRTTILKSRFAASTTIVKRLFVIASIASSYSVPLGGNYHNNNFAGITTATALSTTMPTTTTTPRPSYIDKLALILVRDRKQLVARSKGKSVFFTPGGKRDGPDETDEDALCRECKEELTVDLLRSTIKPYGVFEAQAFGKPQGTMVRMTCYSADYEGTLTPNQEVEELRWITSTCPHEDLSVTGIMILDDLKAKDLID